MHGVVTGEESRQQLYTMLTRGRSANHIYVSVVGDGDGDPHTLTRPDTTRPSTATELPEHILARDGSPRSASTLLREQQPPAVRLGESVARYLDALHMAAEDLIGSQCSTRQWRPLPTGCCRSGRGTAHRRSTMGSDRRP